MTAEIAGLMKEFRESLDSNGSQILRELRESSVADWEEGDVWPAGGKPGATASSPVAQPELESEKKLLFYRNYGNSCAD